MKAVNGIKIKLKVRRPEMRKKQQGKPKKQQGKPVAKKQQGKTVTRRSTD